MKKSALVALVALPVIAYTGAAAYLGHRIEASLDRQAKQIEGIPNVKLVKREYHRGVFTSTESVTLELMGDTARALQAAGEEDVPTLLITARSDIRHGPWLGGGEFDAGVARSELVLEGEALEWVRKVFGDSTPLDMRTVYHFAGGGRAELNSPAFSVDLPGDDPADAMRVKSGGFSMRIDFDEDVRHYTMDGQMPTLEVSGGDGSRIALTGLKLTGDQTRMFDDEALLYAGTQRFTLDSLTMHGSSRGLPPFEMSGVVYDIDMPKNGDFLDVVARIGSEKFVLEGTDYGPAHYDFSARKLHARTTARLYRNFMVMSADPTVMGDPDALRAQMGQLMGPALELLAHAPVIAIDRLAFRTPQGPASLSMKVSLAGIAPDDFTHPANLLAKLDASGKLSLPEALVRTMMVDRNKATLLAVVGDDADPDEIAQMADAQFEQTLLPLTEQGFVSRADGQLDTQVAFTHGQLTVNGKPFNPAALSGRAPAQPVFDED